MPYEISWILEKRVVYLRMYGDILMEDLAQQRDAIWGFYAEGEPPVHIIVDMRDAKKFPMSPNQMKDLKADNTRKGWTIVLTNNAVMRFVASMAIQLLGLEYRLMESLDIALNYLYQVEPDLRQIEAHKVTSQG